MYNYFITTINTKLTHMFLLVLTTTRVFDNAEQIQYTLTMYGHINQPDAWYSWVLIKTDDFEDVFITI